MKIPFFNYPALFENNRSKYLDAINDVLYRGAYIMQEDLFAFEKKLADYLGIKHAIGVADGTMALIISLKSVGIGHDDDVIVPSHTFVACAAAIKHLGANPIMADCSTDHLISAESIELSLTPKTKAIMPVQLNGRIADMDSIITIAEKYNLNIIEDACQALGAKYNNCYGGTFGNAGAFSFYPSKTLGCFGDGGAIVTNDDKIAERIYMLRDHGRDPNDGDVKMFGFNSRLDNLQAAILNINFKDYDNNIARRRHIASIYQDELEELSTVLLPPGPNSDSKHFDIYQNYEIEADERDGLRDFLSKKGVGTILQWGGYALHQFKELGLTGNLDYTESMTKKFMLLPLYPTLTDEEVLYICKQIKLFYNY